MSPETRSRLVLMVLSPLVFFGLVELTLTVLGIPRQGADPNFAEMVRRIDAQEFFYEVDPELFWRLQPGLEVKGERTFIRTNDLGLRGDPVADPRPEGSLRILLLGDSVTFGYGLPESQTIGARLGARLADVTPGRALEIVNGGVPGYSSRQGLTLLERLGPRLSPDVVIVCFGFNDARDMFVTDQEVFDAGRTLASTRRVLYRSRLYRLLRGWLVRPPSAAEGRAVVARVDPERYAANLAAMVGEARRLGAEVVILGTPFERRSLRPYGPTWFTLHDSISVYRRTARQVATRVRVR
jgi:lysophospholipase L1-like esterase